VFQALQTVCPAGARPFAATVKALLAITATAPSLPESLTALAERTLGYGEARSQPVRIASADGALFVWERIIHVKSDPVKVVRPIPVDWLKAAEDPVCDVSVSWDTPVNAAFSHVYGCRKIDAKLRAAEGGKAARPQPGAHGSYPLRVRTHPLKRIFER